VSPEFMLFQQPLEDLICAISCQSYGHNISYVQLSRVSYTLEHRVFMRAACVTSNSAKKREDSAVNFRMLHFHVQKLSLEL